MCLVDQCTHGESVEFTSPPGVCKCNFIGFSAGQAGWESLKGLEVKK